MERRDEYHMARRVLMSEVTEERLRSRPMLDRMDSVKVASGSRGMTVEAERRWQMIVRSDRRALVHM